ncbi:guanine deaminase [Pigmentiphaga soli]|uniref:Guanine deaminase n=1 Tax=Pigmentiphaga soli TaxID=1007095 RepID=A0ABP8GTW4_9BURK
MPDTPSVRALRGPALSFRADPFEAGDDLAMHHEPDALVIIENGRIRDFGDYRALRGRLPAGAPVAHYPDALILPGFIDAHVHYPQTQIIGAYGRQLMDWLGDYTYAAEQRFADPSHARAVARLFLRETLRAGTTTAAVYCTVHPGSVDAFFDEALQGGRRMIAGKVLMDRNAPAALTDTVQRGYDESARLIDAWHGRGRLAYAVTPRFAGTSTPAQLEAAGALWRERPGTYMQTHIAENRDEIAWIRQLYPERRHYLDIYDHYGLTGPRALFGHCIHLCDDEWQCLRCTGSAAVHCPTSNLFLGSGLFRIDRAKGGAAPLPVALATDVGAGTSLSMLRTMGAAYQVAQLGGTALSAPQAFYLATRGAAQALHLEHAVGSIAPGLEADLVVLDLRSTPLIAFRMERCKDLADALFVQMTMADERATRAVYVAGELAYERPA